MGTTWYILAILSIASFLTVGISSDEFVPVAHAQEAVTVPQSTPCFMNYTAGADMWDNCNFEGDFLTAALLPWEYATGGHFSMIIVSIFILFTYIKYHNAMYPILIGVMFLPLSYFVFPDVFLSWALLMVGLVCGIAIWYAYVKQTKEY